MSRNRVHIDHDWYSENVRIWLFTEGHVLRQKGEWFGWEPVTEGDGLPEPTLLIRSDYWEAIVSEAAKRLPVTDAALEALKDTREVRDRLLTLIERSGR